MSVLAEFSEALANAVAASSKIVARVEGRRRLPASGVIWAGDVVVTAHHVLDDGEEVRVGLFDGRNVPAMLVGSDPSTDLAVLRVRGESLTVGVFEGLNDLKVGHIVLALGRPGKTVQATMGIVSAFGEAWRTPMGGKIDHYLQTDLNMYPGFSGGPLVDTEGRILGINTSGLVRGSSVAVPTPTVKRVVEAILAHGKVRRGYLGIGVYPVRLPESLSRSLGQETGLLINSVETGSPADRGGLMLGDIVTKLDETPTRMPDDLIGFLAGDRIGLHAQITVVRAGQVSEARIAIGERN